MFFSDLTGQFRSAEGAGFDVSVGASEKVANRVLRRLAAISGWLTDELALGVTVADQDIYDLPDQVVDLKDLLVGSEPYERVSTKQLFRLKAGILAARGAGGFFAPRFQAGADKRFGLYPAPTTAGATMTGLCSIVPTPYTGDALLPFPDDADETILHGMKAIGYDEIDENRSFAEGHEAAFLRGAEELRRRTNSRVGSGPVQVQLRKVHFR